LPPLSSGGASIAGPSLRFHTLLIELDMQIRYSFLLYAHTEEAFEKVADDVERFRDELGNKLRPAKTAKQTTQMRTNTPITVVPECDQIEFDPPSLTKKWGGE
jgi:hypothetical protein